MADIAKFILALLLVIAGVAGFYLLDTLMIVRVLSVVAGVVLGGVVGSLTAPGRRFVVFARESVAEAKKVVWPTKKETIQTTGVVFVFVLVMTLFLALVDYSLQELVYTVILGRSS